MTTVADWCREIAGWFERREDIVLSANGIQPRGICWVIDEDKVPFHAWEVISWEIYKLPSIPGSYFKFPRDDSGFDLRAKWLRELADTLEAGETNRV